MEQHWLEEVDVQAVLERYDPGGRGVDDPVSPLWLGLLKHDLATAVAASRRLPAGLLIALRAVDSIATLDDWLADLYQAADEHAVWLGEVAPWP